MGLTLDELEFYWGLMDDAIKAEETNGLHWREGFKVVRSWKDYMIVYETDEKYYIICSGTSWNGLEWVSNLLAWPTFSGFHFGFYNTARRIKKELKHFKWSNKPVEVVCYSRGIYGTLLAYQMIKDGLWSSAKCISFGAPEAFKRRGIRKISKMPIEHYRVFTDEDIVPKFGASRHWSTEDIELPSVSGFDHCMYSDIIKNARKLKEE